MSPTGIEALLQECPDQPFRLGLSSGDSVTIPHSGAVRVIGTRVIIFPNLARGRFFAEEGGRYVSTVNIVMAAPLARGDGPSDAGN